MVEEDSERMDDNLRRAMRVEALKKLETLYSNQAEKNKFTKFSLSNQISPLSTKINTQKKNTR